MKNRHTGTLHLVNHGCAEHTDILETYKNVVDPSLEYEVISLSDRSELAQRLRSTRSNCYLSTDVLAQLAPEVSTAKEAVAEAIQGIKNES
jgi:hypothetical protein